MAEAKGGGAAAFVEEATRSLAGDDREAISDADLERVLTAAVRLYARRAEASESYPPPVSQREVTATDVLIVASEMIRAVDLNLFDLTMWHGRVRPDE